METINVNSPASQANVSKKKSVKYWIVTGLFCLLILAAALPDILSLPEAVKIFNHLGYPVYLLPFLGFAKTMGVLAILAPGFSRLKEWAYAGIAFDLIGAAYSNLSVGDPITTSIPAFIGLVLLSLSYSLYHRRLKVVKE